MSHNCPEFFLSKEKLQLYMQAKCNLYCQSWCTLLTWCHLHFTATKSKGC